MPTCRCRSECTRTYNLSTHCRTRHHNKLVYFLLTLNSVYYYHVNRLYFIYLQLRLRVRTAVRRDTLYHLHLPLRSGSPVLIIHTSKSYRVQKRRKGEGEEMSVTFSLSLMEPLPRMDILVSVSSCSLFSEFPRGPRSFPTKLNCTGRKNKSVSQEAWPLFLTVSVQEAWPLYLSVSVNEVWPLYP